MAWPSGSDYQTAVQNPKTAFQDPDLQACSVRPGAMGLPWVASGNFASVFCLEHASGRKFAARVFNRQVTVQKARYQAVSDHLGGIVFGFMVSFEYQEQGIQVAGQWYPIIKMDWAEGVQFGRAVEDNISNPEALRFMAAQLRAVYSGLQGATMSHCDLQHGNIMVNNRGDLVLVDYDDFFVPKLVGESALALGMPNYQHPKRGASDFHEKIDNFSALVIYMSLGALAADQSLFQKYNNGDNLVLKESDYKDMAAKVWLDLAHSNERVVVEMTDIIRQACKSPIDKVPLLEDIIKQTGALPAGKRPVVVKPVPTPTVTIAPPVTVVPPPVVTPPSPPKFPQIVVSATSHDFGTVLLGGRAEWQLEVQNPGTGDLQISAVNCSDPAVRISGYPSAIPAGTNASITVIYEPAQVGDLYTVIEIHTNLPKKEIRLWGEAAATGIRRIVPNQLMVGDTKQLLLEGVGFVRDRIEHEIEIEEQQGRQKIRRKKKEYEILLPSISCAAPGVTVSDLEFVSPAALRVSVAVPRPCPPGKYDVIVTNPDGSQIVGSNLIEVQGPPPGQTLCPHCNRPTDGSKKWCEKCGLPLRSSLLRR